ncbi:hypothetical protein P7C70_g8451, partial [Phenoliferia sp. Uapishka_3]
MATTQTLPLYLSKAAQNSPPVHSNNTNRHSSHRVSFPDDSTFHNSASVQLPTQQPQSTLTTKSPPPVPPKPKSVVLGFGAGVGVGMGRSRATTDAGQSVWDPTSTQTQSLRSDSDDVDSSRPRRPSPASKFAAQFAALPGRLSPKKANSKEGPPLPPRKGLSISGPLDHLATSPFPSNFNSSSDAYHLPPPPSHSTMLSIRSRTASTPHATATTAYAISQANRPPLPRAATVMSQAARFANTTNLKERLVAGAGIGKEWGKKGREKLEERWKLTMQQSTESGAAGYSTTGSTSSNFSNSTTSSASHRHNLSSASSSSAPHPRTPSPSPLGALDNPIKLPTTVLGVKVPKKSGIAFGVKLESVVEKTRIEDGGMMLGRKRDLDEVTGDEARKWLPAIAFRCLQYLEHWGKTEEGIYRVPGSSYQIAQLRALFDAGMDLDLREIHPGDLDPHGSSDPLTSHALCSSESPQRSHPSSKLGYENVCPNLYPISPSLQLNPSSTVPDSILSSNLESAIDVLVTTSTGFSACSSHFLGQAPRVLSTPGMVDGQPPRELLEKLRELFGGAMPAEHYYLLRALAYHLARLAGCAGVNKMTLSNLRLILSPTLRLSPVMLAILVEQREMLFSKANDSARLREASLKHESFSSHTPAHLSTNGASRRSSLRATSQSSPLLNPPASPRYSPTISPNPPSSTPPPRSPTI